MRAERRDLLILALITLAGVALRLVVWRWREFQGLGGDEQEYFDQALRLLRDREYVELRLMRPPLYTLFLAAAIRVVDSLVMNLRLVQALISAATVPLVYLMTLEVARAGGLGEGRAARRGALVAAALAAFSYTLAANATELLTETVFLAGLTGVFWLLLRAARLGSWRLAALAGLGAGALCLVRSVGLPLLPLGAVWLLLKVKGKRQKVKGKRQKVKGGGRGELWSLDPGPAIAFALALLLVVLPWTARNYATYGGLIVIDTTGAENLWLDNDPAGREAVKAQLYALGEERLARQRLASERGVAVILADPGRFAAKAWGELLKFFALEQADDLLARPQIWVSPAETWARLLLGDLLWLVMLVAGSYGLALGLLTSGEGRGETDTPQASGQSALPGALRSTLYALRSPAWLLAPWALYVLLTTLIFHVELRYRLPLYPALLAYGGLVLAGACPWRGRRPVQRERALSPQPSALSHGLAALVPAVWLGLTLLHAPYPALAWQLGWKHWHLGRAEAALARGDAGAALVAAEAALARDDGSALARVALARVDIAEGDLPGARMALDAALAAVPDHPQAHVLRGDVLRALGDAEGARADLAFEAASRQDLQAWLWERGATPAPPRLALGDGLDLGFVRGWHALREGDPARWTTAGAELRLSAPEGATRLGLRLASGRPDGSVVPVEVWAGGASLGVAEAGATWAEVELPLPAPVQGGELLVELRAPTFSPRAFDRASPDGRSLGVLVAWAEAR